MSDVRLYAPPHHHHPTWTYFSDFLSVDDSSRCYLAFCTLFKLTGNVLQLFWCFFLHNHILSSPGRSSCFLGFWHTAYIVPDTKEGRRKLYTKNGRMTVRSRGGNQKTLWTTWRLWCGSRRPDSNQWGSEAGWWLQEWGDTDESQKCYHERIQSAS